MEEQKHFKNAWKVPRLSEAERIRSNTLPGLLPSDEQSVEHDTSTDLCTLIRPYSCELYGIDEELSMRFQDRMWKVNNDRVSTWTFSREDQAFGNLNWSMQNNEGSFTRITTPMKDQLEYMEIPQESASRSIKESTSQPIKKSANQPQEEFANQSEEEFTNQSEEEFANQPKEKFVNQSEEPAAIKAIVFSKKTCLRPKFKVKSEILEKQKAEKRHAMKLINDNITPTKKLKDYEDVLNELSQLTPSGTRLSAAGNRDMHKVLQAGHLLKTGKKFFLGKRYMLVLLSMIFVIFISVILYENQETRKHSNDFANAIVELKKRIYGQDHNIRELCEYLQSNVPSFKVIVLFGDTGVGKSYTVEIIRKNFPRKYAIRQYFPPLEAVKDINLPLLYPNLIILENLKERDLTDVVNFLKARQDTYKNRFVTILAVFNFEQMVDNLERTKNQLRDASEIGNAFLNQNIEVEVFFYESLNEYAFEMCIIDAIKESKLTLNAKQFDLIKENLLLNEAGCKGAYRQVQIIGRQHEW